ncbi:probable jasmonic acid carboxyl methyltransferase 1 isoform X1 [Oryza sativa Japonica Group]|uniref:Os06g0315000 protein n=4 Tax=Oryza TaxID=4527 RepID=A3BB50_ORYSJ|nr:salicylate carboxymethyltransferase isoform X1 [Oryza sativa Japonica Group]XP_025881765.1 salicylate carboxymethyltransferase isoform X1 [Oryza sativa Japonica Group]XP_025881766.1 salicylate carboxymethyltransferase isoform X1 [Oryza sativa Japonica Group]XP_025881767.1 salicylate carboxymethyltransferase isoform X1 [Oryza sativa Japonica Group]XP_025881768.1 salicylate carboxymethyltransferase isoform X1 [Oryza sativa Japonica Group]EAZ36789.1 hypothetical protein OsJ_21128 [Oryza sativa|eukprot:NP_001174749.1 Os06g0315000 [Oryza sativa Japonica Group]
MATIQIVHMNPGQGETSYARNSTIQKTAQDRMKPLIEEAVTAFCGVSVPKSMAIADLGCSSGPNALTLISSTVDAIHRYCMECAQPPPEMCLFLNDLPSNDFNSVAKSLAEFKHSQDVSSHHVVVANMVPGSFYERLFTSDSVHFFCSSISLQWLSKAPEELAKRKIPMYDSDERLRLLNHEIVADAYARQFRKDFTLFLSLRARELVLGGRLIFSLIGRCSSNPASVSTQVWKVVSVALNDMASRGVISKEKFDTFHIPIYAPMENELNGIIEDEGSFQINKAMAHDTFLATDGVLASPNTIAAMVRAVFEPAIVQHFGFSAGIMDDFASVVERLSTTSAVEAEFPLACLCFSLTRAR